ncbi:hypothetical protein HS141_12805 [Cetobacterium somerae]|uniref:hypothetical protein n=1 Tax=Cetobacterium somerae TaxID=188913 RepID=UPI00211E8CDD|nr:hypothetical protein [Cetobacterium somerae]MCQ9627803.1 hypothetical protein [Cetobacterium somerae]
MEIALSEKKILIIEEYLKNPKDKTSAVKAIDPSIKSPGAYAWKLFNEIEVKEYLVKRRLELLKESAITLQDIVKGASQGLKQSLGLEERVLCSVSKGEFVYSESGIHPDSGDAKNYYMILERVLGGEISGAIASKELQEDKKLLLQENESRVKIKIDNNNLESKKIDLEFKRKELEALSDE